MPPMLMTRTLMPPHASDDYAAYPKSIHSSLRNGNYKKKIPNTQKKNMTPILMPPALIPPMMLTTMMLNLNPCSTAKTRKRT